MNKKIVASIVLVVVLVLAACALIYFYAPGLTELLQMHTIPQH
jgi:hypothetical protein